MVDKKKTSFARLNIGLCYPPKNVFQDADFASWVSIVKAPAPQPGRRPAAAILVS